MTDYYGDMKPSEQRQLMKDLLVKARYLELYNESISSNDVANDLISLAGKYWPKEAIDKELERLRDLLKGYE